METTSCISDPVDLPVRIARLEGSLGEISRQIQDVHQDLESIATLRTTTSAHVQELSRSVTSLQTTMRIAMGIIGCVGVPLVLAILPVLLEHHLNQTEQAGQVAAPTIPLAASMPRLWPYTH